MDAQRDRARAASRFGVDLSQNQLRKMSPPEVEKSLLEAAGAPDTHHMLSALHDNGRAASAHHSSAWVSSSSRTPAKMVP